MKFETAPQSPLHGMSFLPPSDAAYVNTCSSEAAPALDLSCKGKSLPPSPASDYNTKSPVSDYNRKSPASDYNRKSPASDYNNKSPVSDYNRKSPASDYNKSPSPLRESVHLPSPWESVSNLNNNINCGSETHKSSMSSMSSGCDTRKNSISSNSSDHSDSHYPPANGYQQQPGGYESSGRSCAMTPPSDSDSPKRPRLECNSYDHTPVTNAYSAYPAFPTMTQPPPVPMPAILPALLTRMPTTHEILARPTPPAVGNDASAALTQPRKLQPRPFKAYPKDPAAIAMGPHMIYDPDLKKNYCAFRSRMMDSFKRNSDGVNVKMRRTSSCKSPTTVGSQSVDDKDAAYYERRRKNNEAAKRSRDARRAKEDEIAIRAAFLEQEYIRLKYENAVLRDENNKFKSLIYRQ